MFLKGQTNQPAHLQYGDGEFTIIMQGEYVLCAHTGAQIPLKQLKYWNVERQEAYASAQISYEREEELRKKKI